LGTNWAPAAPLLEDAALISLRRSLILRKSSLRIAAILSASCARRRACWVLRASRDLRTSSALTSSSFEPINPGHPGYRRRGDRRDRGPRRSASRRVCPASQRGKKLSAAYAAAWAKTGAACPAPARAFAAVATELPSRQFLALNGCAYSPSVLCCWGTERSLADCPAARETSSSRPASIMSVPP
jgi:hypothetical protein